jgi:aminoglycoside phosphotransferase family enzyme
MSWVFIAGDHAYKLKKPVRLDRLDFRSLSARHFYCLEELRLNRRLAPEVYLDVVPLCENASGELHLGGRRRDRVVDWLVKMKALDARAMLDAALRDRRATQDHMTAIARCLADFHAACTRAPFGAIAYRALLRRQIDECELELCNPRWHLAAGAVHGLCRAQREFVERNPILFDGRLSAGRVVEAHGDLRPEHVYLGESPAIIDALEFSAELRMQDAIDEVGFLALECERLGDPVLAKALIKSYLACSRDDAPPSLIEFHQSCRATSRARLAIAHLYEEKYRNSPKWPCRAQQYLDLALSHMAACGRNKARQLAFAQPTKQEAA